MLEYTELKVFIAVSKHLSFSKAAQEVNLSAPQITKVIAGLESKIKCKLLSRTTRSVRLTADGHTFLASAVKALSSLQEAAELFETQTNPFEMHGSVKITAPNTLGVRFLSTPLSIFTKKFPNVNVEILLVDSYLDFVEDEIDVALRILKPTDSSLIAKKIADNPISFYASPGYLKDNKGIHKVEDLVHHKVFCIPQHWVLQFERSKRKIKEIIQKTSIQCSNGDLLVEMACQGVGVVLRSDWGVRREVEDGKLVKLELDDRLVSDTGVYLVYPKQKNSPPRVKALINIMRVSIPLNLQKS